MISAPFILKSNERKKSWQYIWKLKETNHIQVISIIFLKTNTRHTAAQWAVLIYKLNEGTIYLILLRSCSSLSFRLITKRQDNELRAMFCLDLCSKHFSLKNDSVICTLICAQYVIMGSKKKSWRSGVYNYFSIFSCFLLRV